MARDLFGNEDVSDGVRRDAVLSACGTYRYSLTRAWGEVKKLRRLAKTPETPVLIRDARAYAEGVQKVADELADLVLYADLLAARLGIDLGRAVAEKFNAKSVEIDSPHLLPEE